jgi:hypothetical protein
MFNSKSTRGLELILKLNTVNYDMLDFQKKKKKSQSFSQSTKFHVFKINP